jgi:hypothetical protein
MNQNEVNIQTGTSIAEIREMFHWLFEKAEPLKNREDIREMIADWWFSKIKDKKDSDIKQLESLLQDITDHHHTYTHHCERCIEVEAHNRAILSAITILKS